MSDTTWDVLVIGAGPGGYPAAIRASQLGFKVACVERENLGGVCLNWGCVPSKALLTTAEAWLELPELAKKGITVDQASFDFDKVVANSRKVAGRMSKGVAYLFKKYGVTVISGNATVTGEHTVSVTDADGNQATHEANHIVIATGARARFFPSMQPDGDAIQTYREAIVDTRQPKSLVILGAGAIGIEFAYFHSAMGAEVTVVEGMDEILPLEDREMGKTLRKALGKQGVKFELGTFVDRVERTDDGVTVVLQGGKELVAERCLLALGITPNTSGIGLEDVGVTLDKRGFIEVDADFHTRVPSILAVGDVCNRGPALAHTAMRQAHVAMDRLAGHHAVEPDYTANPSCTYCQPQVASVGRTEEQLKQDGVDYKVGRFPFSANAKAVGAGHEAGFIKVLVDPKYGEILGAHIIGHGATELISEYTLARSAELTADEILATIHGHPTLSEAALEAVGDAMGSSVHI